MPDDKTKLFDIRTNYDEDADGVFRKHTQHISQDFLDGLKEQRNASLEQREGEFMRVASIPVVVVEKWMREGFDLFSGQHSAHEIVKKLKEENLDAFLTTEKRV